jgi:hypothetical protein
VKDVAAVQVEIEAFLSHGSCREHEWPKRRIESFANDALAHAPVLGLEGTSIARYIVPESQSEVSAVDVGIWVDANAFTMAFRSVCSR